MKNILQKAGLTENEAKIYLCLLEYGYLSVLEISKKTKIYRTLVHQIVDKLIQNRVCTEIFVGKKRKIKAKKPDVLLEKIKKQAREIRKKELSLEEYLPQLRKLHKHKSTEYQVTILEGKEGIKTFVDEVLENPKTEMLEYIRIEELTKKINPHLQNKYFPKKFEIGLPTRFLFADTPAAHEYIQKNYFQKKNASPMQAKFLPDDPKMMRGYKVIWNNNVAYFSSDEEKVTIIRDENIANHERAFFEFAWQFAQGNISNREKSWEEIVEEFAKKSR